MFSANNFLYDPPQEIVSLDETLRSRTDHDDRAAIGILERPATARATR
ncbi:hypothetical protein [Rhodococcoides yunnanense]|nr:hypothetical protein [Rhodococcus yunnanensis]